MKALGITEGQDRDLETFMRIENNPITRLEAFMLFGVQNITAWINAKRKEGWIIKSNHIPMAHITRRLNEVEGVELRHPRNLPTREIVMTQWWFSR